MQLYWNTSRTTEEMSTRSLYCNHLALNYEIRQDFLSGKFTIHTRGHYKANFACLNVCYIMSNSVFAAVSQL